ncbi:MAG: ribbon-helix-helix protein, CopG family [Cyanobacteria bacterium REEB65]|nr:ribbon-helix-helix protein, CopG family [Cyanobacteria bacterium REEB65]
MTPRGGARPGAGRKPKRLEAKQQFQVWLEPTVGAWSLDLAKARGQSRSELIADALEAFHGSQEIRQAAIPLPPDLIAWIEEQAASSGVTPAELLTVVVEDARDIASNPDVLASVERLRDKREAGA